MFTEVSAVLPSSTYHLEEGSVRESIATKSGEHLISPHNITDLMKSQENCESKENLNL